MIDNYHREAREIDVGLSLPRERVIRSLNQIIGWRGKPTSFVMKTTEGRTQQLEEHHRGNSYRLYYNFYEWPA